MPMFAALSSSSLPALPAGTAAGAEDEDDDAGAPALPAGTAAGAEDEDDARAALDAVVEAVISCKAAWTPVV